MFNPGSYREEDCKKFHSPLDAEWVTSFDNNAITMDEFELNPKSSENIQNSSFDVNSEINNDPFACAPFLSRQERRSRKEKSFKSAPNTPMKNTYSFRSSSPINQL